MIKDNSHQQSLSEVHQSIDTTIAKKRGWKNLFSFLGPAYLVSVGYMDPGNWATDLQGGSKFGYSLIWVLLMSNLMALLLQGFAARLGIVRGRDLAQANREAYPKVVNYILYFLAEIAIAACDLAEVLGMAIGIQLLFGLPLSWGVLITILDTFLLLYLQRLGIRKMEAFIIGLVAIIAFSFLIEIVFALPNLTEVAKGFVPNLKNKEALYIAIAIIGATVMPHNLYLHSALVQTRKINRTDSGIKQAIRFNRIDSTIALNIAFFVNAAILVLAATVFFKTGNSHVGEIKEAHQLLAPILGNSLAPKLFAIALIAAGQSSTITGTLAGQIVMEGYLQLRINPIARRLLTRLIAIVPAVIVIFIYGEDKVDAMIVFSQVILSVQLGFAIIPLIHFVSDKSTMGIFTIKPMAQFIGWVIAALLISLNAAMIYNDVIVPVFTTSSLITILIMVIILLLFLALLCYIILHPLLLKKAVVDKIFIHPIALSVDTLIAPSYNSIVIALDFSVSDIKLLQAGIGQGSKNANYFLFHVVESASAGLLQHNSDDYETRKDKERLDAYVAQLTKQGFNVTGELGYKNRAAEIIQFVKLKQADMLVVGAHRHTGIKDIIYGETVNSVRHEVNVPVFIVNV
jgi:manganese transport protein